MFVEVLPVPDHRLESRALLDRALDEIGVVGDERPLVGVFTQEPDHQAHGVRRVVDRRAQQLREQRSRVGVGQQTLFDPGHERGRDVVTRFALLRFEQLVGEATQVPDARRERRPSPPGRRRTPAARSPTSARAPGPRSTSQPTIQQKIVGGIRAATSAMNSQPPAPSTSSSRSPTRRAVLSRSASIRRGVNQGMTTRRRSWWSPPSEPEQGARTLDGGSVGTGAAHHLEDAGTERGVEQQRVAPCVREHPEAVRRAHDPRLLAHRSQLRRADRPRRHRWCGRGTAAHRQYRHAAAAYRSTSGSEPARVAYAGRDDGTDGQSSSRATVTPRGVRRTTSRTSSRAYREQYDEFVRVLEAARVAREQATQEDRSLFSKEGADGFAAETGNAVTASGTRGCAPRCSRARASSPRCCSRTPACRSAGSASRRSTTCAARATARTTAGCSTSPTTRPAGVPRWRCSPCTTSTRPWPRSRGRATTG